MPGEISRSYDGPSDESWNRERAAMYERLNGTPKPATLAGQVDALATRAHHLEGLAGEMLATIKLNVERGYLVATNDGGKLNLTKIIAGWERQLAELESKAQPC